MEFLNHLDDTALFHKSARHFIDALFERKWRNDIDYHGRGMFHLCFYIQHNALFLNLLKTSTWVYLGIAFIEPSQLYNLEYIDSQLTDVSNIIELVVLCIFGVNFLLEACLLVSMYSYQAVILHRNMGCFKRFFYIIFYENIMSTCILLLDVVFFTDYTLYRLMFPYQFFRFSRLFRPSRHIDDLVKLMFHSVKMRKTIRGFINIIPKVFDIMLFFALVVIIYGGIGIQFTQDEYVWDTLKPYKDYTDFGSLVVNLYIMITLDNWPAFAKPLLYTSPAMIYYFLPYVIINLLFFFPIPIAVLFDSFRRARGEIIVMDLLEQKKSLMLSFTCLDMDKDGLIDLGMFKHMMERAYSKRVSESNIGKIYMSVAGDLNRNLAIEKFSNIANTMQNNSYLFKKEPMDVWPWEKLKYFFKRYLKFDIIVNHWGFEAVMFLFVLINTVEMIWLLTDPDDDTTAILNTIDNCMLYIFTAECAFRILGTGFYIYFSDSWNKFDFSLVVISYATDILLSFMDFAKNARSARFLKISRLQKTLRITKSIKSFRIFKFCMNLLSSFYRIKQLLEIIIISLPAIWRTLSLILIMFYLWACVGCELFREGSLERMDIKPYGISNYYTYAGGILELAHIMIANGWSELMFNYCERFELRHTGQAYFISFHAIVNIVLRSLLSGLVWEVFSFVDKTSNNANKDDKINEIDVEELSKNLKKNHFHTLRFKSVIMINDEEPDDLKYRVPLEIKGLRKEIKKEMGDDFRGKFKTKIPSQARKSVQVDLETALTKDARMRLHQKRASLTNAIPYPKSSMHLMKGNDNSQKCFKIKRIALENDIEKADSNFRMIPSITPAQTFENKLAGLNLDYGINDEKESHDNSQIINSPDKPQESGESGKEMSQGNLFVDSQNKIVSFSDDLHVAEAEPTGKKDVRPMEILTQGFLCSPIKPKFQPFEDSKDKPQENSGGNQGKKIDAKSILPQKPNSDCEDDDKAGKEGFQFSKGPPHIPTNTNHSHTEKSSENKDELVLRKDIQLKTKTQQMNDKAIGKVPNVNEVYARRRSRI